MMHTITLLSFTILILYGITILYVSFIFYFIFKGKELRIIAIETAFYQLFTWIILLIYNTFVIRILIFSVFHFDMNASNMLLLVWKAPLYIILIILLVFGPLKGILYVLQTKKFHYRLFLTGITSKKSIYFTQIN
ncbi:hypothetical protein CON01_17405 [Bacillus thuringiensis]|uniref:Uncharacterized protein n=2 Tax=Bacillus thuringiensis TaxID=1428 RepID=A0A9X6TYI6_BACTU|nr:hypothetical protein [Bacillus thuringiensis]PDX91258.1 hypothetical protein COM78_30010 [Bacillus thuringiensis]PED13204.1 hypothetical protein CON01_17405 [Bacillus thuringiensis]PEE90054.1 hypothetical protein COM90_04270 [Bacillus thuringiensis]PFF42826.1 hypothetical protein CN335_05580 [Bacillus thuringiensis]PFR50230.1 hypothetical protein COK34_24895 [Bacillus thuringiensis]